MMMKKITRRDIDSVMIDDNWAFMNRILYRMCSNNREHKDASAVIAKVCLIGRSYSASIERRKTTSKKMSSDVFYEKKVARLIIKSDIDKWLSDIQEHRTINEQNLGNLIRTHSKVMKLFKKISGMDKRSLASKYLHFHLPKLFYIYDSRAVKGLRVILPRHRTKHTLRYCDEEYSKFCQRLFDLQNEIRKKYGRTLTTRQLDRLLLLKA